MVQILPTYDPGRETGQAFGGGISDALKLLGERQLGISALDKLKGMDLSGMNEADILSEVGKATIGLPHMQKQASDLVGALVRAKRAEAMKEAQTRSARGVSPQGREGVSQVTGEAPEQGTMPAQGIQAGAATGAPTGVGAGTGLQQAGMRDIPSYEETTGTEPLLSAQEIGAIAEPFIAVSDEAGMVKALSDARQQKLQQRELQIQAQQARTQELQRRRELESELAQNVMGRTGRLLSEKGISKPGEPPKEEWNRLAYDYFDKERNKPENKNASDEKLWQEAGRKLERKIEDISGAADKFYRPTWRMDKDRRAKNAQRWVQEHLKAYGNNNEERSLLRSIMMDNGWSREEASALIQPFSSSLSSSFGSISKMPSVPLGYRPDMMPQQEIKRAENVEKTMASAEQAIAKGFKSDDSLLLLKSKLVREKGFNDTQAVDLINKMIDNESLKLTEAQIAERPFISENTVPSLYDLFSGRSILETLGPLVK